MIFSVRKFAHLKCHESVTIVIPLVIAMFTELENAC